MSDVLDNIVGRIVAQINPDKIILFGSRATGHNAAGSDYDLCVIKKNIPHRRRLAQQIYQLLYGVGAAVDIVVDTPEHFTEMRDNPFYIHYDIERQGVVVYDKSGNVGRMAKTGA